MPSTPDLTPLKEAVFTYPCIDNHTHNLLRADHSLHLPMHIMTTEALGPPLEDVYHGLAHLRARRMLAKLYDLPEESTWDDMLEAREKLPYEEMCLKSFKRIGIQCLLLDDGLHGLAETCYDYKWHDRLTTSPTKRIVRLEPIAQDIVMNVLANSVNESRESILATIKSQIQAAVKACVADPEVVGFKSVACYRTGLDIQATPDEPGDPVCGMDGLMSQWIQGQKVRINRTDKAFEDWFIRTVLHLIEDKPLQFHTGLGDTDMLLVKSDPAYLQQLCEAFPDRRIILLHSSYPFTRQAGYLATCFKNVYLDYGEVFPQVAAHGQRAIIREMLEIAPTNKLLWSTDAHHHPETYYVSVTECREAMYEVLSEIVTRGEMSVKEAVAATKDMLFHNSNRAYNLGLEPLPTGLTVPGVPESPSQAEPSHLLTLDTLASNGIRFVRVQWLDYTNNLRFRAIPLGRFLKVAKSDTAGVLLAGATLGLLQNDLMSDGFSATGEQVYRLDFSTLRKLPDTVANGHASIMGWFEDRGKVGRSPACPRGFLDRVVKDAKEKHGASFLVGFESEFILLETADPPRAASAGAWSTSLAHRTGHVATRAIEEIAATVDAAGIELQMFHAESAPGQYEIVTGPLPPLEAVDALVLTRDIMYNVAAKYGLQATLLPRPFADPNLQYAANSSHCHISITSDKKAPPSNHPDVPHLPADFASFMSGLLAHFPAVICFNFSTEPSYVRVRDGSWSGGTWAAWGRDNKEAPLRLCGGYDGDGFNVEIKSLDGLANPYIAVGVMLTAGMTGVEAKMPLEQRSVSGMAGTFSAEKRKELGVELRIPKSWDAAKKELMADAKLREAIGDEVVDTWIRVKETEKRFVGAMSAEDAHAFWLQHY